MILLDQAGAAEYRSRLIEAEDSLKGFVEHFFIQDQPTRAERLAAWRIVPDASPHFIVTASHQGPFLENIRCMVVGARSRFVDISLVDRGLTFGLRLHPGTLPLLTRLPAWEFNDRCVAVEDIFGARGRVLANQLAGRRSIAEALRVLAAFFGREFANQNPPGNAAPLQSRINRAKDLASLLGLPDRTLHARIKEHVGLAPKRYLRLQRLHRTLNVYRRRTQSWSQISSLCGFSDQAHMVREFKDLLGEAPGAWQRRSLPICSRQTGA
jgi:AraC-like DNA-binding protein